MLLLAQCLPLCVYKLQCNLGHPWPRAGQRINLQSSRHSHRGEHISADIQRSRLPTPLQIASKEQERAEILITYLNAQSLGKASRFSTWISHHQYGMKLHRCVVADASP